MVCAYTNNQSSSSNHSVLVQTTGSGLDEFIHYTLGKNFFIKIIANVGMTQQWSQANKDKKPDVGMVTM